MPPSPGWIKVKAASPNQSFEHCEGLKGSSRGVSDRNSAAYTKLLGSSSAAPPAPCVCWHAAYLLGIPALLWAPSWNGHTKSVCVQPQEQSWRYSRVITAPEVRLWLIFVREPLEAAEREMLYLPERGGMVVAASWSSDLPGPACWQLSVLHSPTVGSGPRKWLNKWTWVLGPLLSRCVWCRINPFQTSSSLFHYNVTYFSYLYKDNFVLDKDIFFHLFMALSMFCLGLYVCICEFFWGWLITLTSPEASQFCLWLHLVKKWNIRRSFSITWIFFYKIQLWIPLRSSVLVVFSLVVL